MSTTLSPASTSLSRLALALERMERQHGFQRLADVDGPLPSGLAALLLTEDPQRNPEVLDACVILPEALKCAGEPVARLVAGADVSPEFMRRFGVSRVPTVVVLRDGQYLGALSGILAWGEYQAEFKRLMATDAATVAPRPSKFIPLQEVSGGCQ